ncbi:DUF3072 domain-containing protein [Histidinibacterium lentulum]|uniref:DUF3072 domain-containing protein n=1 Tax=Histidinibacterium lentulum TaxID=2480588 RepID=A0A3N2R8C3_9RHOB|nr:DUF3072 domain-containing protein [Histidinibacterium lentulum]ROU03576.1 DUF3072 domain-containing protein [Histidinibacterium lentulum]
MSTKTPPSVMYTAATHGQASEAPMTDVQRQKLRELALEADEPMDGELTQLQAQKRIAALEEMLGR